MFRASRELCHAKSFVLRLAISAIVLLSINSQVKPRASMFRLCRWLCLGSAFFALVQHVTPLRLEWPLVQLFPTAWAGSTAQFSVYLSLMSMGF